MSTTCTFSSEEFSRGLRMAVDNTRRAVPLVLNQAALNVAGRAMNATRMADKEAINAQLGHKVIRTMVSHKDGVNFKWKRRKIYGKSTRKEAPLAALIINSRRLDSKFCKLIGFPASPQGLNNKQMTAAIKRLVGSRTRSAGFKKSGYVPAIQTLASGIRALGGRPFYIGKMKGFSIVGANKGSAIPATAEMVSRAVIENTVRDITNPKEAAALREALDAEGYELQRHVREKLDKIAAQFNKP